MKAKPFEVELTIKENKIKIFINGIIHVCIKADEFVAFQSWREDYNGMFYIEFYTHKQDFFCEYDCIDKWKTILKLLNEKI